MGLVALRQVGDRWVEGHGHGRESFTKLRRVILPKPRPSFEEWSKDCAAVAKEILGLSDTLDPEDPYELRDLMRDAYDRRESPRALIEGAFEEDLARADYDEQLAAEALEHEEE